MLVALWWVAVALAVALSLLLALLATPVRIELSASSAPRLRLAARFLGGLTPWITLHDSNRPRRAGAKRKKEKKPSAKRNRGDSREKRARIRRALRAAPALLRDLLRVVHIRRLEVDADIGLGDPAETGQLFGLVQALRYALPAGETISVEIRPDFTEARVEGAIDAEISLIPLALAPPGLRFAARMFGWRLLGARP